MAERSYEFGRVDLVQADAIGVPGQRRFRLRARTGGQYALVWVEREQIQALGLALEQLLTQVQVQYRQRPVQPDPGGPLDDFPMTPTIEFTAGRMGLGYDSEHDLAVLELTDIERNLADQEETEEHAVEPVTLVIRFSRGQAAALRDQCEATLAAGRPRCHLCGAPMGPDGSHFCIRANGHVHGG